MKTWTHFGLLAVVMLVGSSCKMVARLEDRAEQINRYENVALTLSKENRELRAEIDRLKFEIQTLKGKNQFLELELAEGKPATRVPASIPAFQVKEDLVQFNVYKWKADDLLTVAEKEFGKNHERSAQFYQAVSVYYPQHHKMDDKYHFKAGISAYESGAHTDWALQHMQTVVEKYPASEFYRGAKLWIAMAHLKMGDEARFFETAEEFRKKYRNTPEWKILSGHYEKIVQKYKSL